MNIGVIKQTSLFSATEITAFYAYSLGIGDEFEMSILRLAHPLIHLNSILIDWSFYLLSSFICTD